MRYNILHRTTYRYGAPVTLGHHEVRLRPREFGTQRCVVSRLDVTPAPLSVLSRTDYFGNHAGYFMLDTSHHKLSVLATSEVELSVPNWPQGEQTPPWEDVRDRLAAGHHAEAVPYIYESPGVRRIPEALEYAQPSFRAGWPLVSAVMDLTERIYRDFRFDRSATTVNTPTREVFQRRRGVCQDFAHLELACLRSMGLAARYVSGYLCTEPPPGEQKLIGADASHAWVSVYCPNFGWVDFDPTNNVMPSTRHVTLAWGRDYGDVCPVKGVFLGGGSHVMDVAVDVIPLEEMTKA